jgi:hypothetical protein
MEICGKPGHQNCGCYDPRLLNNLPQAKAHLLKVQSNNTTIQSKAFPASMEGVSSWVLNCINYDIHRSV